MRRFSVEKGWLDHLLAILPGIMGVYAVSMSVSKPQLATMLAVVVALSGLAGYGLSLAFEGTKTHGVDAWLFAILGFVGFFSSRAINRMLPEEGFPFAILAAVMMFALLVAGGLFAWRDATLLFLSLPSLVLFGLVGTIDTWRPGLFLFCGYLLCIALLYARVHQRTMIRWAAEGGSDTKLLRRDVWRWMAGPEYAFAAAGTIILLSFVGAPVIQSSLSGVSENFRVSVQSQVRNSIPRPNQNRGPAPAVPVGRGPSELSDELLFTVKMSEPHYLKMRSYDRYSPRGWDSQSGILTRVNYSLAPDHLVGKRAVPIPDREVSKKPELVEVTIRKNNSTKSTIPTPGFIVEVADTNTTLQEEPDGTVFFDRTRNGNNTTTFSLTSDFTFLAQVTDISAVESATDSDIQAANKLKPGNPPLRTSDREISERLVEEAWAITRPEPTIYKKLTALKRAIASRCKYNLKTGPTPSNQSVADHFYFDSKEGYCDHFATTFTAMARGIGLDARYVTGYLIDPQRVDTNGDYLVRENQSHAWSEVYIENYGWVPFDATEGAEDITPKEGESNNFAALIRKFFTDNFSTIFAAIGIAALVGVFLLWQRRPTTEEKLNTRRAAVLNANKFQKSLELLAGHPKRFSQTHREFAEFHQERLGEAYATALPILSTIERSLFGKNDLEQEEFKALREQVSKFEELSKRLAKEHKRKA